MRKDKKVLAGEDYYRQMDLPLKIQLCRDRQVYWHRHRDFYELVIVVSGSAHHSNRVRSETIHAGDVFLMPDSTSHRYAGFWNFRYYNILFHPSLLKFKVNAPVHLESLAGYHTLFDFQFSGEDRCSRILTLDEASLSGVISRLGFLQEELSSRKNGWSESAYFAFMQTLVYLLRSSMPGGGAKNRNAFEIGRAAHLMEQDCTQDFTVRELADSIGMSVSSFRHNFTRIVGVPPREYLLTLRLRKAVMLLNGPLSVGKVAHLSGFSDSCYFSRIIRERLGISPREIRRDFLSGKRSAETLLKKLPPSR